MAITPEAVVKYLKESSMRRVDEDDEIKEGDKVSFKEDDKDMTGKVIEVHDDTARVSTGKDEDGDDDIHTVKLSDLKKSESSEEE